MSEGNGANSGIPNADSENVLDDLMQNNVQFDEDEKPKTETITNDDDQHSDISDNEENSDSDGSDGRLDGSDSDMEEERNKVDKNDSKSSEKSQKSELKENEEDHSDISEDEDENITKKDTKEENSKSNSVKKEKEDSGSESDAEEEVEKKPSVASRITRPPQQTETQPEVKKKKGKSYDYATKLNYLFRDARFFLVKSSVSENVDLSKVRGVWSTPPANEGRFNKAFRESRNVIMIYSVKESGRFCGFARLASESRRDGPPVPWLLPPGLSAKALGGVFKIDWICREDLVFQKVGHLYNPWNENKPVKIGRDGQEIEPSVAENLCKLFVTDNGIDMTPILRRSKESARRQRSRPESERSQDIPNTRPLAERARPTLPNRKRPFQSRDGQYEDQHSRPKNSRPNQRRDFNPRGRGGGRGGHHQYGLQSSHRRAEQQQRNQASGGSAPSRSYEEYLRSMRGSSGGSRSYQDQVQDFLQDRRNSNRDQHHRPSYDRSVDEFIRRNNDDKHRRSHSRR